MESMELNKIAGALFGALLVYLLLVWGADAMYSTESASHGEGEEHAMAYPIEVAESSDGGEQEEGPDFATLLASADPGKGERVFNKCKACHKVEAGANGTGPTMHAVVGRDIAAVDGFNYSGAMAGTEGSWTPEALDGFLANPKKYIPGTAMGFAGLKKIEDRANVVSYLQTLQ